ncbi:MAG TPA: mechanosensitive ion channel family protein [Candidatus Binatia bacterium]|nr:mechanosensitive ion channel family protein [Candidatus Binatia bacterium]
MHTPLTLVVFGNALSDWLIALGLSGAIALGFWLLQRLAVRKLGERAGHTATRVDDALLAMIKVTHVGLVVLASVSLGAQYLSLTPRVSRLLDGAATAALFLQLGLWGSTLLRCWLSPSRGLAITTHASAASGLSALTFMARLVLWSVVGLLLLDNFGIDITTLVAGLGIGGIAVALAVQNVLGDLFASLSIIIDKPFVIGDFVMVEDYAGTVENVGLKTTRLRSVDGELIVFSNSDLLRARLRNFEVMTERRVVFGFGVPLDTAPDKLERIPAVIQAIVGQQPKVRFERSHFARITGKSLDYETVYWMTDPDYGLYMDTQQRINLAVIRALCDQHIHLANMRAVVVDKEGDEADPKTEAAGQTPPPPQPRGHS